MIKYHNTITNAIIKNKLSSITENKIIKYCIKEEIKINIKDNENREIVIRYIFEKHYLILKLIDIKSIIISKIRKKVTYIYI